MGCKHFLDEFKIFVERMPVGVKCPECGCSAEYNGLSGDKLIDRIVREVNEETM